MAGRHRMMVLGGIAAVSAAFAVAPYLLRECDACDAASTILLTGTVLGKCTVVVSAAAQAIDLPITTAGSQRILVGTMLQNCTGNRSYTLSVSAMNCAAAPAGAKLLSTESDEYLAYSAEFNNPTTGGSQAVVSNLLSTACTGQIGRQVTHAKINNETSSLYVNFTGAPDLAAGTYQDIVTISLNMN